MKKGISLILVLVMSLLFVTGCGSTKTAEKTPAPAQDTAKETAPAAEKFVIGYTNLADTDVFCMSRKEAFIEETQKDPDMEILFTDANNDISKQLDQIDNFIAQKVNAIVIVPVDYEGIVSGVEKANAAGIPVVALGIQSAGGEYTFVGSKNVDAGRMQGEFMKEKLPQNAKVLYLQGVPGMYHSTERLQGFKEALLDQRPDIEVLANLPGNYDRAEGMKITEDWIQSFSQFDAIIAANDQMALGALQALKGANRLEGVMISGIDGTKDALDAIKAGEMSQSIFQNALAQSTEGFKVLQKIKNGEEQPKEVLIPFESITAENVDEYMK